MWQRAKQWLKNLSGDPKQSDESPHTHSADQNPCCDQPGVHIAYRGKADDRMSIAYDRKWQEVRYYQPNGLRVFCSKCRRRVY